MLRPPVRRGAPLLLWCGSCCAPGIRIAGADAHRLCLADPACAAARTGPLLPGSVRGHVGSRTAPHRDGHRGARGSRSSHACLRRSPSAGSTTQLKPPTAAPAKPGTMSALTRGFTPRYARKAPSVTARPKPTSRSSTQAQALDQRRVSGSSVRAGIRRCLLRSTHQAAAPGRTVTASRSSVPT